MRVKPGSIVFYDAIVLLGTAGINQTEKELRVIGYRIDNKVTGLPRTGLTSLRKKSQPSISSDGTLKSSLAGGNGILKCTTLSQEVNMV